MEVHRLSDGQVLLGSFSSVTDFDLWWFVPLKTRDSVLLHLLVVSFQGQSSCSQSQIKPLLASSWAEWLQSPRLDGLGLRIRG